jgi:hypothetical protein
VKAQYDAEDSCELYSSARASRSIVDGKNGGETDPYRLLPAVAILLGVGAALAEGMRTFTNEQAAQRHCPADAVVWLNTSSATYHLRSDPWYGRTQRGAYVCKIEAEKDGMHPWTSPK